MQSLFQGVDSLGASERSESRDSDAAAVGTAAKKSKRKRFVNVTRVMLSDDYVPTKEERRAKRKATKKQGRRQGMQSSKSLEVSCPEVIENQLLDDDDQARLAVGLPVCFVSSKDVRLAQTSRQCASSSDLVCVGACKDVDVPAASAVGESLRLRGVAPFAGTRTVFDSSDEEDAVEDEVSMVREGATGRGACDVPEEVVEKTAEIDEIDEEDAVEDEVSMVREGATGRGACDVPEEVVEKTVEIDEIDEGVGEAELMRGLDAEGLAVCRGEEMLKYWSQRYRLFSRFDEGIKLDEESWYSVTPERIAIQIARRCRCEVIVDAFCGAGGNAIQFAKTCRQVIAVDIDPLKVELARENAQVYGVSDNIEFMCADFLKVAPRLRADAVFLAPPWGGPSYSSTPFSFGSLPPVGGPALFVAASRIAPSVVMQLPRNINVVDEAFDGLGAPPQFESIYLNGKRKCTMAYFGTMERKRELSGRRKRR